jgi:hypothetical protein
MYVPQPVSVLYENGAKGTAKPQRSELALPIAVLKTSYVTATPRQASSEAAFGRACVLRQRVESQKATSSYGIMKFEGIVPRNAHASGSTVPIEIDVTRICHFSTPGSAL